MQQDLSKDQHISTIFDRRGTKFKLLAAKYLTKYFIKFACFRAICQYNNESQ